MANQDFSQFEAVIRTAVNPAIEQQFNHSQSLWDAFKKNGPPPVNQRGYRIPFYGGYEHPWHAENGIRAHTQLLRGELELPHAPAGCKDCKEAYGWQLEIISRHIDLLRAAGYLRGRGHRGASSLSSRRNEVAEALRYLASGIQ